MRRFASILGLLVIVFSPSATLAAPVEQGCRTETWAGVPGKSAADFKLHATDGCHTYIWSATGSHCSLKPFTFTTTHVNQIWEAGSNLPQPNGPGGYGMYQAQHEANLMWRFGFEAPPGTEVTVRCQ